jgi:hypothetical protein
MIEATCHCQNVRITIPRKPRTLTNCDCSMCRRYGTLWAYYQEPEVSVTAGAGGLNSYAWGKKAIRFMRCGVCGCITNWQRVVPGRSARIGINARLFEPAALGAVRIRRLDGALTERYLD